MLEVQHRKPRISPYGDPEKWELLWLDHCGAGFPRPPVDNELESVGRHHVLLADPNDLIVPVPMPKYLRARLLGPLDALGEKHPPHTRVYHRASGGALCTVADAVSQRGARRLLPEFGVKKWSRIWDVEMGDWVPLTTSPEFLFQSTLPTSTSQEQLDSEMFAAEYESEIPMPAAVGSGSV